MALTGKTVAVAGAGVAGLCAALACARAGADVTVFEREPFPPQDSASAIAGGMLAPYAEMEALPLSLVEAGLAGIDFWAELLGHAGAYVRRAGSLVLAAPGDEAMLERMAAHLAAAPPGAAERVGAARIAELEPGLAGRFADGIFLPREAHLEPRGAMRAAAAALEALGGRIVDATPVEPADLAPDYDHVVDCRGYVHALDDAAMRGVKGEIAVVESRELALSRPVRLAHPRYPLYVVPHPGGQLAIGATTIEDSTDESGRVFVRSALELLGAAYALHPCLGEAQVVSLAAGIRPAYPDNLPRITPGAGGVRAGGLYRHGYLLGPALGRAAAAAIAGEAEDPDLALFGGRFNAGGA